MKWLRDNFVGMGLLGVVAVLLLISLALAVRWAWPLSADIPVSAADEVDAATGLVVVSEIGPIDQYQVINNRPLFSVTRQPVAIEHDDVIEVVQEAPVTRETPQVKLTGVFISPDTRIASLMPLQGDQISVTAKEGESLIGDYVGWQVSQVQPRHVVLTSREGETLKLELKVHDVKIEEPPKPVIPTVADADLVADGQDDMQVDEDGQPISRAEQIRARIAERREDLRRQQAEAENEGETKKAAPPQDYQSAIRAMINNRSKDKKSNDKNDS